MRLLLVGDSAALGVGADAPQHSLAGLIAADFPNAQVRNLARSGAMLADVRGRRRMVQIAGDADAVMADLAQRAPRVVWLGIANMGLAPLFVPPWSWWISARVRRARRLFAAAALRHGACYLDFFREARDDVFSHDPLRYFAADGIHPSSSAYRHCYEVLRGELG
jgi:lysophospholipase L1-like esterase